MTTARVLALFEAALALPPDQRVAHAFAAAGDDPAVVAEVEALLAAHARSDGFLEPAPDAFRERDLGAYRLLRPLGAGGMGRVYLAERRDGSFEQRVAIKVLASALGDPESVRRAEAERRFLGWLDHAHIARILDGGTTPEGQPYVVMEYVDGNPIDAWCREQRLGVRARATLFLDVLSAVDAAHRALIVHRDIKPANVMVSRQGEVKLLDFGIAKSLDGSIRGAATVGERGPLTPDYASPEQLAGKPLTTACDVYSLGLVLYELLTGRRAYAHGDRTLAEIERDISQHPPSAPSTNIDPERLAIAPRELREWRRRLAGDLDRVLLKALEPEPAQRYGSARAFADDLQRWLDGRPVEARAGGALYRMRKLAGRNRLAFGAAVAVVLALAGGFAVAAYQGSVARAQADRAERANRFLLDMIGDADLLVSGRMPTLVDALDKAAPSIPQRLGGQPQLEGDVRLALGRVYLSLEKLAAAQAQLVPAEALLRPFGGAAHADALLQLAILDWWGGRYAEAEGRMRDAIARLERETAHAAALAGALTTYGALLNDLGRFNEAVATVERTQALIAQGAEIGARERAGMLGNLGYARHGLGQLDAAIAAHGAALAAYESVLPPVHPDIAVSLNNQAMALQDAGRRDEALASFRRSLEVRRQFAGADNSMTVKAQANLAVFLAEGGELDEAAALIADALAHAPTALGPDQVALANLHSAAARVAIARGDGAAAADAAERALAIYASAESVDPAYPERARVALAQARVLLGIAGTPAATAPDR